MKKETKIITSFGISIITGKRKFLNGQEKIKGASK